MSLVNNMLRDLDRRRKDSDGSSGSVKLMPARDFVSDERRSLFPLVIVGLVVVVVALVYSWAQLSRSSTEQQLDIRVQPMSSNSASDPERLIQELEESIIQAELAANTPIEPAVSQVATQVEPQSLQSINETMQQSTPAAEHTNIIAAAEESVNNPPPAAAETKDNIPRSVREGPVESVKEAPEYSNEQMDTIAVQAALRQIADGQTVAAYQTLEDHIASNRFAHQSRETYAKLLMSGGRTADASALIDAGLDLAPNHSGFKKVKARVLMATGQLSEAVEVLISRAPEVRNDPEYHDLLASAQLSSRDFAGAMISYRGLVQLDETQGKWWYGFASAHDQLGNSEPARQAYAQAMRYSNLSANLRRRSQERLGVLTR
ncbi:MAG: tetratricopeptide repeat protein [Pseudohongiellaceae bacterium]